MVQMNLMVNWKKKTVTYPKHWDAKKVCNRVVDKMDSTSDKEYPYQNVHTKITPGVLRSLDINVGPHDVILITHLKPRHGWIFIAK